jgi:hypothetical protein
MPRVMVTSTAPAMIAMAAASDCLSGVEVIEQLAS